GWKPLAGEQVAPGTGERETWDDLLIRPRLLDALRQLNPGVPGEYLQQAVAEIAAPKSQDAVTENPRPHQYLVGGYPLSDIDADGIEQNPRLRLLGADPSDNDWIVVNQVTLRQRDLHRRFDIVLFVNGMPLSIFELKR